MKTPFTTPKSSQAGVALMITMIMSTIALTILLAGVVTWTASSNKLTHRSIQYNRSVAAAEGDTEKVISYISRDFLSGGAQNVSQNLNTYRSIVPTPLDSDYWNTWQFDDGNGNLNLTYVQLISASNTIVLEAPYTGLKGYASIYAVASHARDLGDAQDVTGGVSQQLQLAGIPIFQFGMYSSGDMEISCGQPFTVTGSVHSNGQLYVEPDSSLTFNSGVTAVGDILFERDPAEGPSRGSPAGNVTYVDTNDVASHVQALTLPIGATNTPEAVREIIEPPLAGELATSPMGLLRYYNQCDMILTASNSGVTATSGRFNNFGTQITNTEVALFASTGNSFFDARENKTVQPIDINIGALKAWTETNSSLRPVLMAANSSSTYIMNSIYVVDYRTAPVLPDSNLGAVRVSNGQFLPVNGLTVATGRPLYVWKDYNQTNSGDLGTDDTVPASFAADAITILSDNWQDENQQTAVENGALPTIVNAAFLTGAVDTTFNQYSGGMENFPRFLESWGSANTFTYNGSMIKMFPSLYATNYWQGLDMQNTSYYSPPARNWAYDTNFDDPNQLPPHTPSLLKVIRGQWATVPPGTNVTAATP